MFGALKITKPRQPLSSFLSTLRLPRLRPLRLEFSDPCLRIRQTLRDRFRPPSLCLGHLPPHLRQEEWSIQVLGTTKHLMNIADMGIPYVPDVIVHFPELPIQPPILHQQVMGRLALHGLHQSARRYRWWYAHKQMHMIRLHRSSQNLHVLAATDLADQLSYPLPHLSSKHRLAVLRREHEVVAAARRPYAPHAGTAASFTAYRKPPEGSA